MCPVPKHRDALIPACHLTGMIPFSHLGYLPSSFMNELRYQFFQDAFLEHPRTGRMVLAFVIAHLNLYRDHFFT